MYSVEIMGDSVQIRGPWASVTLEGEDAGELLDEIEEADNAHEIQYILGEAVGACSVRL